MTREQIQAGYVHWLLENTSPEELIEFFTDRINEDLNDLDDVEAIEEIKNYMGGEFTDRFGTPTLSYA